MNETCPHCGAAKASAHGWDCGTVLQFGGHVSRSWSCQDMQIQKLTAERDAMRQLLADAPVAFAAIQADSGSVIECGSKSVIEACYGKTGNIETYRVRLVRDDVSE